MTGGNQQDDHDCLGCSLGIHSFSGTDTRCGCCGKSIDSRDIRYLMEGGPHA
jgi:hypothetical protein